MRKLVRNISAYRQRIQFSLFPYLDFVGLPLTPQLQELVAILDLLRIEEFIPRRLRQVGAPLKDRAPLTRAFVAQHFFKQPDTRAFRRCLLTDEPFCCYMWLGDSYGDSR